MRGQRRGPQNEVSDSALSKRRGETGKHPRDSQEEQGCEVHPTGSGCRQQASEGPQEAAGWFRARLSGKENAEYRTNAAQRLRVPCKNTQ